MLVFALIIALTIPFVRPIWLVVTLHPQPTRQLISDLRRYGPWLIGCMFIMIALAQTLGGMGAVKARIPQLNPYWADSLLIDLDQKIFFGLHAWEVTRAVLPDGSTAALDFVYRIWQLIHVSFCTAVSLLVNRKLQLRAVLSFQLTWILLGNVMAIALSSVGPVFYEADPRKQ